MSEKNDRETHYEELDGAEGRAKIGELIRGIHIAMLTTRTDEGGFSSRPMAVQNTPFDGTLWFLTRRSSEKIEEARNDDHVLLAFADPRNAKYLALKGRATVSQDRQKIHELWNAMYKAWFPEGENDPEIAVLRVDIDEGDFWEASSSRIVRTARYLAAAMTGGSATVGTAGHVRT